MKRILILMLGVFALSSCNINPSVMFKVPNNYQYYNDQTIGNIDYKITPNDIIAFSIYTNDGFKLIDMTTSVTSTVGSTVSQGNTSTQFLVEPDGMVKLPIIGKVKITNLTIREAEKMLETQYATFYNKPFVMLRVVNRRVIVFPGSEGAGRVVNIENENTTLIEALALAGGISQTGKSDKIRIIRGDLRNPKVILINLKTVEGMQQSNMLLQANDIIYIESVPQISSEVLAQITPIVGIITSIVLIISLSKTF